MNYKSLILIMPAFIILSVLSSSDTIKVEALKKGLMIKSQADALKKGLMIKSQRDVASKANFIGKEPMIPSNERDHCEDGYVDDCSGDGDCCPESWIGDGLLDCEDPNNYGCDLTCYDNDGGDCAEGGDGGTDGGDTDGGDTDGGTDGGSDCAGNTSWIGDGWCDDLNNNADCAWDAGDCCESTCVDAAYSCELYGGCNGDCLDPDGNDDDCEAADDGGADDGGNEGCEDGYVDDCSGDGDCCPESWIGDGYIPCDGEDQPYGCDLTCYDNDGGDCDETGDDGGTDGGDTDGGETDGGTDGGGDCVDCVGNDCSGYESWIGDGICDDGEYGIFYNCLEFECDNGDCGFDSNGECESSWEDDGGADDGGNEGCEDGWLDDCSGDGDCCPEGWIGDGYLDCEDQPYGCDLTCYDNDGGDCDETGDDGGTDGGTDGGETDGGTDGGGDCVDCVGNDCSEHEDWVGDGLCDDGTWGLYFNCDEFDCDGGDCLNEAGECEGNSGDDGGGDDGGGDVEAVLIIGESISVPSGEASVPLYTETVTEIAGIQFTLVANPGWAELTDISITNPGTADDCFQADFNSTDDGVIGLIFSLAGCTFPASDESYEIGALTFQISENAEWGENVVLDFTDLIVAAPGGTQLNATSYSGSIQIGMVGDVNQDGSVDVIDVVSVIAFILQTAEASDSQFWAADVNEDGSLDILDVVTLVDWILNS